jgi:hypothetical protein
LAEAISRWHLILGRGDGAEIIYILIFFNSHRLYRLARAEYSKRSFFFSLLSSLQSDYGKITVGLENIFFVGDCF